MERMKPSICLKIASKGSFYKCALKFVKKKQEYACVFMPKRLQ